MRGSLAGAAASQRVTEAYIRHFRDKLKNLFQEFNGKKCLTVRFTNRTEVCYKKFFIKAGHTDPVILYGKVIA